MQRITKSPWADVWGATGFMFLVIASVGALLVVALKLQAPSLGAGASAPSVIAGIVIAGLATLGTPTQIGDVAVTIFPLGGLLAVGAAASWSAAITVRRIDVPETTQRVWWGAALGPCLAVLCGLGAFVFRIGDAAEPLSSHTLWAMALGLLWGSLFGAFGGFVSGGGFARLRAHLAGLKNRFPALFGSLAMAAWTLGLALLLAALATMAWIVALLAAGPVRDFGASDALAALIHFVLFFPNAVIWVLTIGMGAGLHLAAGLAGGAREADVDRVMSLSSWPGGTPWFAYLLLAIPVLTVVGSVLVAARRGPTITPAVLSLAAVLIGASVFVLGSLATARVAPGLFRPRAFAYIAPQAGRAALLSFLWTAGGGVLALALRRGSIPITKVPRTG